VGLKSTRYFVRSGDPIPLDVIVTDLDGRAVAGAAVHVVAEHVDWQRTHGSWHEVVLDTREFETVSAGDPVHLDVPTTRGGTFRITATVRDAAGRPNESEITRWLSDVRSRPPAVIRQEEVTLVPDKESYRPGDVAEILVAPPFTPAEGLLTLRRSGVIRVERFTIDSSSSTLRVPIDGAWAPNVHVQVDVVGASPRVNESGDADPGLPKRPAFAAGSLDLPVAPVQATLTVTATPREAVLRPAAEATIDLAVADSSDEAPGPVDVAVIVIDEAVLALSDYRLPNPIDSFYQEQDAGVSDRHLRGHVLLPRLQDLQTDFGMEMLVTQSASTARAFDFSAVVLRRDFNPLALFAGSVITDASGHATVRFKLPDTLTRYRVMAAAATRGAQFGATSEATITARLPLMVRPSPPRFFHVGDRFELPVVVQNEAAAPVPVSVALRATNAEVTGSAGVRVTVPARGRVEVPFSVAARNPGTARFQVVAASPDFADASEIALPVRTPATTEALATYGQIDDGAIAQRVNAPANAFPEYGGLTISTSSTALQALTDAVLYLVSYPYECAEQIASRMMAVVALKDVLSAFKAPGLPDEASLQESVARDVRRLVALQNRNGEVGLWQRDGATWPYLNVHVAHALVRAKAAGFSVPQDALEHSMDYLDDLERYISKDYDPEAKSTVVAYALYVRKLAGDADAEDARKLIHDAGGVRGLPIEGLGWLLAVLSDDKDSRAEVDAIRSELNGRVTETASAAHFAAWYAEEQGYLLFESSRRADAILLDALIGDQPDNYLIPKIVEGLLGHRTAGRWENTQENVFVLLALNRYFNTYEKATPDFVARAWLGSSYGGEHAFRGRTTERHEIRVPMNVVMATDRNAGDNAASVGPVVTLAKEGPGRLYYRLGLQYAPRDLDVKPLNRGFAVERTYQAVDDKADVRRDKDGVWHIRAGARVRVKLAMAAPANRHHVALVDALPAGFEAVNANLSGSETATSNESEDVDQQSRDTRHPWWWRSVWWFDHENLRDDRVEAFTSLLYPDVYGYSYIARATTPGQFVVPPVRAEEMYHPETFGRGATDRVIIER
jgi:uncharacterized protein YfaS (alpha-2-macroglobulin family)